MRATPSERNQWSRVARLLALLTLALCVFAAPVRAEHIRRFEQTFGPAAQPSFLGAASLAVYQSGANAGDLLVADAGSETIYRFHADGTPSPFSALGSNAIDGEGGADATPVPLRIDGAASSQIAIDESTGTPTAGNIYITETEVGRVHVFGPDGSYLGDIVEFGSTPLGQLRGVAVDSAGVLYVGDYAKSAVHRFVPTAALPKPGDWESPDCLPGGAVGNLAVFGGSIYAVVQGKGIVKMNSASCATEGSPFGPTGLRILTGDPVAGHVFVTEGRKVREYDASGGPVAITTTTPAGGIAARGATDRLYVSQGDRVDIYGAVVTVPSVATKAQSLTTPTRATLNGTVDPDGEALSECHFEYIDRNHFNFEGGFEAATLEAPCAEYETPLGSGEWQPLSSPAELGEGEAPVPVRTRLSGLIEHERYFYRLIATSECEAGEQCVSPANFKAANERAFTLPATTVDKPPNPVGGSSATLIATLNPDGTAVSDCHFEYQTEAQYLANRANEIQTVTLSGATEGTFKLSFAGEASGPIAFDATAAEVEMALGELFAIRLGQSSPNIAVSGEAGGPYEVEFRLALGNQDVEELEADSTELGPEGATVAVTTTREGAEGWEEAMSLPCAEYEAPSGSSEWQPLGPLAELGEGEDPVAVRAPVGGLAAATKYQGRLVASNGKVEDSANRFGRIFETKHTVQTKPASGVGGHKATLNGTVDPLGEAVSECRFEYGTDTSYGQSIPCAEGEAEIEAGPHPFAVHAELGGLDPTSTYHYRLAAKIGTEESLGADVPFTTLGPEVLEAWSEAVSTNEATLKAKINPHGSPTAYRLIWGPAAEPEANAGEPHPIGEGTEAVTLTVQLEGLDPASVYRYRFEATNPCGLEAGEECAVGGKELSFATYAPAEPDTGCPNQKFRSGPAAGLPDCRAYEMVSPPEKNGGEVARAGERGMPAQSALDGESFAYGSGSSFAGASSSNFTNQYIARRGAGGWSTEAIAPPLQTPGAIKPPLGVNNEFQAYSPDLCSAWLGNENLVPLSSEAQVGHSNLYRRQNCAPGAGGYQALTIDPPTEECHFSLLGTGLQGIFVGASADLSEQVFQTRAPLTADAASGRCALDTQIYDLAGGALHLVSVLPDGTASPVNSQAGSPLPLPLEGFGSLRGAVSTDGGRVFWTAAPSGGFGAVYVRLEPGALESSAKDGAGDCVPQAGRACTVALSEPGKPALFLASSADGEEALVVNKEERLEAVDSESGARSAIAGRVPRRGGSLSLNAGVLGAAADLGRIYFVSAEALAGGASEGANNLYLYEAGKHTLIGELSDEDVSGFRSPVAVSALGHTARVSPDGAHLAFVSNSPSLAAKVGYDNATAQNGEPAREVYLYDAAAGKLACASCNPSGARPRAEIGATKANGPEPPRAAMLPVEPTIRRASLPLAADGSRLFFEARDALVPTDTNGTWDVYEWERAGHGSCRAGGAAYFAQNEGCVNLISTGLDEQPSQFFDADPTGANAFVRTASNLDGRDEGAYDIYDAREGGGFAVPAGTAGCEGEACQSPPGAPPYPTPSSEAFQGAGDIVAGPPCGAISKRARRLGLRSRRLARAARHLRHGNPRRAKANRRRARRLGHRAHQLSKKAKRCRRGARRRGAGR